MFDWDQLAPILKAGKPLASGFLLLSQWLHWQGEWHLKFCLPFTKVFWELKNHLANDFFFFLSLLAKVLTSSLYNPQIKLIGLKSLYPIPPFFKMRARKVVFKHLSKVQQGWNSHRNSITSNQTISQQPCQKVKREAIWHWGFVTRQFIQSLRLPPYWRV